MGVYLGSNPVGATIMVEKPDDQYGFLKNSRLLVSKQYAIPLSDTNFSSLTPSTTAQTLTLPATSITANPGTSVTAFRVGEMYDGTVINRQEYDYVVMVHGYWDYIYSVPDSTINTMHHGIKTAFCRDYQTGKYHTIQSDGTMNTAWTTQSTYCTSHTATLYYVGNSGTYGTTTQLGIYATTGPSASFSSSSGYDYINLTIGSVSLKTGTYFPVEAFQYLDASNTQLHFIWDIYEGDKNVISEIYSTVYQTFVDNFTIK